jgi:OOP family OmpA-OmpF porin
MKVITTAILFCSLLSLTALGAEKAVLASQKQSSDLKHVQSSHIYVGGRLGWGYFQDSCSRNANSCDDVTLGGGIYIGYQLNYWFALEGGFTYYGKPDASYSEGKVSADTYGAELTGKFSYPLSSEWSLFSRLGAVYQDIEKKSSWDGKQDSQSWNALAAVGLNYHLSPDWSLRAEYQFIDGIGDNNILKSDLHFTSLGVTYHFGQKSHSVEPVPNPQLELETVTSIPSSEPKVEPIVLGSDGLFDIDSAQLKYTPELTALAQALTRYPHGQIHITGYTDNTGSEAHNQHLSEQRAISVSEYFKRMGINEERLLIIGKGESSPIADNNTQEGRQNNRRVEVRFELADQQPK